MISPSAWLSILPNGRRDWPGSMKKFTGESGKSKDAPREFVTRANRVCGPGASPIEARFKGTANPTFGQPRTAWLEQKSGLGVVAERRVRCTPSIKTSTRETKA